MVGFFNLMADGHTHTRVTLFSGSVFSTTLLMMGFYDVQWLAAGFVYQILCSPDRDLNQSSIGEYYLRKCTLVLQYYWRSLWYPYSISMKHRGKSHATYGTAVRFLYLISPFIMLIPRFRDDEPPNVLFCLASQVLAIPIQILIGYVLAKYGVGQLCLFITGVWIGDLLHLAWDKYYYRHVDLSD